MECPIFWELFVIIIRPDKKPNLVVSPMLRTKDKPYFADAFPYLMLSRFLKCWLNSFSENYILPKHLDITMSSPNIMLPSRFTSNMLHEIIMMMIFRPSLSELNALLEKEGVDLEVEEKRSNWKFNFPLRFWQNISIDQRYMIFSPNISLIKTISYFSQLFWLTKIFQIPAKYFHWRTISCICRRSVALGENSSNKSYHDNIATHQNHLHRWR